MGFEKLPQTCISPENSLSFVITDCMLGSSALGCKSASLRLAEMRKLKLTCCVRYPHGFHMQMWMDSYFVHVPAEGQHGLLSHWRW